MSSITEATITEIIVLRKNDRTQKDDCKIKSEKAVSKNCV